MTIRFLLPEERPYGALSNEVKSPIMLDGIVYDTPEHYIYSTLLKNPIFKQAVSTAQTPQDVRNLYSYYFNQELISVIRRSLYEGYIAYLKKFPTARDFLMEVAPKIIYDSTDPILGGDLNLVGNTLEAVREELREVNKDYVYSIYLVYEELKRRLFNGEPVLKLSKKDYSNYTNYRDITERERVFEQYKRGQLVYVDEELRKPGSLPQVVLDTYLKQAVLYRQEQLKETVFTIFLGYVARLHPDVKASMLHSVNDRHKLVDRVFDLYKENNLPREVMSEVRAVMVMDPDELSQLVAEEVKEQEFEDDEFVPEYSTIYISPDNLLSPRIQLNPGAVFTLRRKQFPTVMHYVYYRLMEFVAPFSKVDMYEELKTGRNFRKIQDIEETYSNILKFSLMTQMTESCERILPIKFQVPLFRSVLRLSGTEKLVYASPDPLLGQGPDKKGENIVGKVLEELRRKLVKIDERTIQENLNDQVIIARIMDIMNTFQIVSQLCNMNGEWTMTDALNVIRTLYTSCSWFSILPMSSHSEEILRTYAIDFNVDIAASGLQAIYSYIYSLIELIVQSPDPDRMIRMSIDSLDKPASAQQAVDALLTTVDKLATLRSSINKTDHQLDSKVFASAQRLLEGKHHLRDNMRLNISQVDVYIPVGLENLVMDTLLNLSPVKWSRLRFFGDLYGKTRGNLIIQTSRIEGVPEYDPEEPLVEEKKVDEYDPFQPQYSQIEDIPYDPTDPVYESDYGYDSPTFDPDDPAYDIGYDSGGGD